MNKFSSGDAAIYGFSFLKRAPGAVIGILLLMPFVLVFQSVASFWPYMIGLEDSGIDWIDNLDTAAFTGWIALALVLGFLFSYAATFMIQGAILRPLTRDRWGGWILGLKLGVDELRLFLLVYIVLFVIGLTLGLSVGLAGHAVDAPGWIPAIVIGVLVVTAICALIYISVRLSPAYAATIGERRFVIFEAWNMTRGRFWSIFGAYILAFLITLAVVLACWIIAFTVMIGMSIPFAEADNLFALMDREMAPAAIIAGLVALILFGLIYVVSMLPTMGVGAYIYRQWRATMGNDPAESAI